MAATLQKAEMCDDQMHGSRKVKVTILASEWGSSNGGLSTLNRELAKLLSEIDNPEGWIVVVGRKKILNKIDPCGSWLLH